MTDQTKHDIGGLQTENKAKRHELEKLQNEMDDAMESLSIIDNAIQCGFMKDKHSLIMQKWAKEYRDDITRIQTHLDVTGDKYGE
tara:strand:+ start:267 stop:521 length:255 start_codon:yes stop_codon:yes gene_type:complete